MPTLRHLLIVILCLSTILAACAPATPSPTSIPLSPSSPPKPTLPPATLAPTPEPVGVGIPVIEYNKSELLVVSSITGKVLDEFKPIPLGPNFYSYTFSSDGRTLALVTSGQLYLIDLPSWKYRASDVGLHGWLRSVIYNTDETLLLLASGEPDGDLRVVDAKSGEVKASGQAGFSIRSVKFTADEKAIMVYGPQIANTGVAANAGVSVGAPKAALFALSDLSVLWSVKLAGVRDGTFPKEAGATVTQDIYLPGASWHYEPGIAFDPNRDILYAVHGDEDKLTTVDFTHRKVSTVNVHAKTSWFDQLLSFTAGIAYAKGMDGTTKQTVISQDGKFLYVSGSTETVAKQANSIDWDITDTPIGLQVIATEDGTIIDQKDNKANSVRQSPDSSQAFLSGWQKNISYETPWTDVYDTSSNSLVRHFDNVYLMSTRRMDGKIILVSSYGVSENLCYMTVIDPASWTVNSEWNGVNCFGWLTNP